ncbi:MAG: nitrite/sulfite reductase [Deltaproteobacteria bacterium]|nr:MAG: nitrite/sulfite reductase [Deltaproteobacteria bacterium]
MYRYDDMDLRAVTERAAQFGEQVRRRLAGELTEAEFKPLRLQNGLYMQLHAYMLRVAIPYGLLSAAQLRKLAHISRKYDRGYGHFTTRQNIQFNWPDLEDVPRILEELAEVEMHAIQSSGNCIRNTTSDPFAGVAKDELEDPRPYCELIRQWSTFHPEFAFLPRKFKIAVTGAKHDRAAIAVHDIGLALVTNDAGEVGFEVRVGGGQGRTPILAEVLCEFLPKADLLSYCEAILRVYNRLGRRDNKYKARIKILVQETGRAEFARLVDEEWALIRDSGLRLTPADIDRFKAHFEAPSYLELASSDTAVSAALLGKDRSFSRWAMANVTEHRVPGYSIVALSLKAPDRPPGDVTHQQMDSVADLADEFSFGRLVVTHRQNLVFSDVESRRLPELFGRLEGIGLGTPNFGKVTDLIACPGLDYCNLASARSLNIAEAITARFADAEEVYDIGDVSLNISGCINACGHHHVGNIGILGIDKEGVEHYQIMLGGNHTEDASFGEILGRALEAHEVVAAIDEVLGTFVALRTEGESFIDTYRRVGAKPFKEAVYGGAGKQRGPREDREDRGHQEGPGRPGLVPVAAGRREPCAAE